jgi:hypothetical protein
MENPGSTTTLVNGDSTINGPSRIESVRTSFTLRTVVPRRPCPGKYATRVDPLRSPPLDSATVPCHERAS